MSDQSIIVEKHRLNYEEYDNGAAESGKVSPKAQYKEKNPYYQPVVPAQIRGNRKGEKRNQAANAKSAANSRLGRLPDLSNYASMQTPKNNQYQKMSQQDQMSGERPENEQEHSQGSGKMPAEGERATSPKGQEYMSYVASPIKLPQKKLQIKIEPNLKRQSQGRNQFRNLDDRELTLPKLGGHARQESTQSTPAGQEDEQNTRPDKSCPAILAASSPKKTNYTNSVNSIIDHLKPKTRILQSLGKSRDSENREDDCLQTRQGRLQALTAQKGFPTSSQKQQSHSNRKRAELQVDALSALSAEGSLAQTAGQLRTLDTPRGDIESGAANLDEQRAGQNSCIETGRQIGLGEEQGVEITTINQHLLAEVSSYQLGSDEQKTNEYMSGSQRSPVNGHASKFVHVNLRRAANIYDPINNTIQRLLRRNILSSLDEAQSPLDSSSVQTSTARHSRHVFASRSVLEQQTTIQTTGSDFRAGEMGQSTMIAPDGSYAGKTESGAWRESSDASARRTRPDWNHATTLGRARATQPRPARAAQETPKFSLKSKTGNTSGERPVSIIDESERQSGDAETKRPPMPKIKVKKRESEPGLPPLRKNLAIRTDPQKLQNPKLSGIDRHRGSQDSGSSSNSNFKTKIRTDQQSIKPKPSKPQQSVLPSIMESGYESKADTQFNATQNLNQRFSKVMQFSLQTEMNDIDKQLRRMDAHMSRKLFRGSTDSSMSRQQTNHLSGTPARSQLGHAASRHSFGQTGGSYTSSLQQSIAGPPPRVRFTLDDESC